MEEIATMWLGMPQSNANEEHTCSGVYSTLNTSILGGVGKARK